MHELIPFSFTGHILLSYFSAFTSLLSYFSAFTSLAYIASLIPTCNEPCGTRIQNHVKYDSNDWHSMLSVLNSDKQKQQDIFFWLLCQCRVWLCAFFQDNAFAVHKYLKQFATPLNTWTRSCITSNIYTRAIIYINTNTRSCICYSNVCNGLKKDKKKRLI